MTLGDMFLLVLIVLVLPCSSLEGKCLVPSTCSSWKGVSLFVSSLLLTLVKHTRNLSASVSFSVLPQVSYMHRKIHKFFFFLSPPLPSLSPSHLLSRSVILNNCSGGGGMQWKEELFEGGNPRTYNRYTCILTRGISTDHLLSQSIWEHIRDSSPPLQHLSVYFQ